ncbi:MAG: hypothetical protein MPJ24_04350 [Pirellulaceae bacterium]|nr:hypothetical protein [Pirellulaceae bacterium]
MKIILVALLTFVLLPFTTSVSAQNISNKQVANHGQIGQYTQPVIRRFEREEEDNTRKLTWETYNREITQLWREFREAGSTPAAFKTYIQELEQAKRRYVFRDAYLLPIERIDN